MPISKMLIGMWIAGMAILPMRLGVGYWRLAAVLRTATPADGFVFSDVTVPLVAGLFRPVILMPRSVESWPLSQLAAALKHEMAHVERKDLWTNLMAQIACAVYWFHPLVWTVAQRMRDEQETACDDAVLGSGFEPASYAEALIATARSLTSTNPIGCHMTQTTLKSRIARLFDNGLPRMSSPTTLRRTAVVFAAAIVTIALLNGNPQQPRAADDQIYSVGGDVSAPRVLSKVDPEYSEEARAAKLDGSVLLDVVIGTDGLAHDINVLNGIGAGLDQKAVEALQKWHFQPGAKDGEPVRVRAKIEFKFRLL
jgi:TonB family protein